MTKNKKLLKWVEEMAAMTTPDSIYWCDGSKEEYDHMIKLMVDEGLATPLDQKKLPGLLPLPLRSLRRGARGKPDLYRLAHEGRGGSHEQLDRSRRAQGHHEGPVPGLHEGPHHVRDPLQHGAGGLAHLEDRRGDNRLALRRRQHAHHDARGHDGARRARARTASSFPACIRWASPWPTGESDNGMWPCAPLDKKYISHFPEEHTIWSYGSGYGGNALLGKKCLALRIASVIAREEGWLAEHMLILGITNPKGEKKYIAGAFPSACGKTNLAMLIPTIPGWKVECVGDDIAWMKFGKDGRLYAINPGGGLLRRGAGHLDAVEPQRHEVDRPQHHLHQCGAHRRRRRLVGGDRLRGAGKTHRLDRQGMGRREIRQARGPPQRALHRAGAAVPGHRPRVGRPERRADKRVPFRRAPSRHDPAGAPVVQLEPRRVPRLHRGLRGDRGRPRPRGRHRPPRPLRHAARSAATTWATISSTG